MKNLIILLFSLLLASNFSLAQVSRNSIEASQNQKAIKANEAQLARDIEELKAFKTKIAQFETAYMNKNAIRVAEIKTELVKAMSREIEQSENKIAQDKQELAQSNQELDASKRETNRSRYDRATFDNDAKDSYDVRDDRRDRKDDQRDVMDDKSDLEKQIARTKRQKEIYATLKVFTFSFDPTIAEKAVANKALLKEFERTMENDIAATKVEIEEDKREAVEDSRERREDKRERAEKRRN